MLRLVTNLRRSGVSVGHRLSHHSSSRIINVSAPSPSSQLSWRRQHIMVATNKQLVAPVLCRRGLATSSTASEKKGGGFTAWYLRMLDKHPLPTKCITAASILASADMTAQLLANMTLKEGEAKQDWDKSRTLRMTGIGFFMSAPFLHMWFNGMVRIWPSSDVVSTVKKVLAGQLLASPVVNSIFFAVNSFLQGETGEQAIEKIKRDLWPTWKSGAMYWPILDFITFRYIKIHLQVFFNNCCSFIWTIYLTSMAGKKAE